jgi:hypothetical protein
MRDIDAAAISTDPTSWKVANRSAQKVLCIVSTIPEQQTSKAPKVSEMKFARIIPLAALASGTTTKAIDESFEPDDFNVTAALHNLGVVVETLPQPPPVAPRSDKKITFASCPLAVSMLFMLRCRGFSKLITAVRILEHTLCTG